MSRYNFEPGDVVISDLGFVKGHEQEGVRPCVVIKYFPIFKILVILPTTTKDKGYYTQVRIPQGEGGLKEESFVLCHQIRALSIDRVKKVIGKVNQVTLSKIKVTLSSVLEI